MMFTCFLHFSFSLWTALSFFRTEIIFDDYPKIFCPRRLSSRGIFRQENFPPRRLLSKKDPFCQEQFCPRKCLATRVIVHIDIFARRGHPIGRSMWFGQSAGTSELSYLGNLQTESSSPGTLLLKTC